MTGPDLPLWTAILVALFALAGAALSLLGTVGLTRLQTFYERVHAPTLGTTMGMAFILLASILYFTVADGRFMPRELLIGVFLTVTTPVTLILLARAALFRDRTAGDQEVPDQGVSDQDGPAQDDLDQGER